ncbi:Uncharacterised protein r2_g2302 [Pycnogonum litorale]
MAIFDGLDGSMIQCIALKTRGAAGPSVIEAKGWQRFCTQFSSASNSLCEAIASVAKRISTTFVDPATIDALTACRLIPLSKNPGVRPIGIGEVLRRIIGKAILRITVKCIKEAAGPLQLCAGHEAGCEADIHAMNDIMEETEFEGVLLVDASNAFNSLSRMTTLHNIQEQCPALAQCLINFYRQDPYLFVNGVTIKSSEGTTQ